MSIPSLDSQSSDSPRTGRQTQSRVKGNTTAGKKASSHRTGHFGESLAAQYLQDLGYRILERNWRSPYTRHEIDLIAQDKDCIVFVEVKTARSPVFGDPLTWITPRKRRAIIHAARAYVACCPHPKAEYRFDAVAVGPRDPNGRWAIHHVPNAFTWDNQ